MVKACAASDNELGCQTSLDCKWAGGKWSLGSCSEQILYHGVFLSLQRAQCWHWSKCECCCVEATVIHGSGVPMILGRFENKHDFLFFLLNVCHQRRCNSFFTCWHNALIEEQSPKLVCFVFMHWDIWNTKVEPPLLCWFHPFAKSFWDLWSSVASFRHCVHLHSEFSSPNCKTQIVFLAPREMYGKERLSNSPRLWGYNLQTACYPS